MMRSFFIYMSKAEWAKKMVTNWPFAWRAASRFVAGEKLEDAIEVIKGLNAKGINATLDQLGEHTTNADEARKAAHDVVTMLDAIATAGVRANVSIKLTQIGLGLDEELAAENLRCILRYAAEKNSYIRVDMEESTMVDKTLALVRRMHAEGLHNVGTVIQSYLYRSEADIKRLVEEGIHIRLCKGAYKEPADVAFPKKTDVDANYDKLAALLIDGSLEQNTRESADGKVPPMPGIASHDAKRIAFAKEYAARVGLPKDGIEFQMLHGIRRDLQDQTAAEGYPVRIYVPFGTQWYPYFTRRLAERPANVWFFISNYFKK